jgi:DNA-binding transcriptional MocR family regulator
MPRISPDSPPLFIALADELERQIREGAFQAGDKLPSLRELVRQRGIGKNTVVTAFELLVARGLVEPKRGAGYFVREQPQEPGRAEDEAGSLGRAMDIVWLMRTQLYVAPGHLAVGDAFPPAEWLEGARLDRIHHKVARGGLGTLFRYGDRRGYAPLRQRLVRKLADIGIAAQSLQIVLTHGANEALDLIVRYFVPPGAPVLVDDPGYYPLFGKLKLAGAHIVGVPRLADGPDIDALEALLKQHRPRLFFTQSLSHNPTGSDISETKARQVLALAERHDLRIIENDALCDFKPAGLPRLCALDQLERTVYVGSFSKSLSAALRVGFLACSADLASDLADLKILTTTSSSEYCERTVETLLGERSYPRHLERLRERTTDATARARALLQGFGGTVFSESPSSLFMWACLPGVDDSIQLARTLLPQDIVLAPGRIFRVDGTVVSPWARYNVHRVLHDRFRAALESLAG